MKEPVNGKIIRITECRLLSLTCSKNYRAGRRSVNACGVLSRMAGLGSHVAVAYDNARSNVPVFVQSLSSMEVYNLLS